MVRLRKNAQQEIDAAVDSLEKMKDWSGLNDEETKLGKGSAFLQEVKKRGSDARALIGKLKSLQRRMSQSRIVESLAEEFSQIDDKLIPTLNAVSTISKKLALASCPANELIEAVDEAISQGLVLNSSVAATYWWSSVEQHVMFGKQEDAFLALRSSAQEATAVGEYGKEWMHSTALNIVEDLFLRSLGNLKGCDFSAPIDKSSARKTFRDFCAAFCAVHVKSGADFLPASLSKDVLTLQMLLDPENAKGGFTALVSLLDDLDKGAVGELEEGTSVLHSHLLQHEAGKALRAGARAYLKKQAPHMQAQEVRDELAILWTTVCEAVVKEDCDMLALEGMKNELASKLDVLKKVASKTEEKKASWDGMVSFEQGACFRMPVHV